MTKIFITGDNQMEAIYATMLVGRTLKTLRTKYGDDTQFGTGDSATGVERAVRYLVLRPTIAPSPLPTRTDDDIDTRHAQLVGQVDLVVVVHQDPLSSYLCHSLTKYFDRDSLVVITKASDVDQF